MRILLVEDEKSLSNAISMILRQNGHITEPVFDGMTAIEYAQIAEYDIVILDVMLPRLDGFEVLRILRNSGLDTPILMLTAKSTIADKVSGLKKGADDYMTKPFHQFTFILPLAYGQKKTILGKNDGGISSFSAPKTRDERSNRVTPSAFLSP